MYAVNVSSIQDFMQCRFRWWCKWVRNRVPLHESPALGAGKLLHLIFEDAFNGTPISIAAEKRIAEYRSQILLLPVEARAGQEKAVQTIVDLQEALPLWQPHFPADEVLEVEEPFEYQDPVDPRILWRGRPDLVYAGGNLIWHRQNRGLASSMNFGTYTRLAKRHYHEHLYGEYLEKKYCSKKKSKRKYGGTSFNLVRKLKYRTNVGKKNEKTKTYEEMFWQGNVSYNMKSPLHAAVMHAMRQHVNDMIECTARWEADEYIPPPNDKMNGGYSGSSEDPFFKVLIGEVTLEDDTVFKDREDTYQSDDPADAAA